MKLQEIGTRQNSASRLLSVLLLLGMLAAYIVAIGFKIAGSSIEISAWWWIGISINIALSCLGVLLDKHPFSLNKVHWYFILVFMGFAPIMQMISGYYPWGFYYPIHYAIGANCVVTIWCIAYFALRRLAVVKHRNSPDLEKKQSGRIAHAAIAAKDYLSIPSSVLLLCIVAIVMIKAVMTGTHFFSAGGVTLAASTNGQSVVAVISKGISAIPVLLFALLVLRRRKDRSATRVEIGMALVCCFLIYSPIATSRYLLGAIAIAVLILLLPVLGRSNHSFDYLIIISLFILFPLLTNVRYVSEGGYSLTTVFQSFSLSRAFATVDFDAYSILARIIMYVDALGHTNGLQVATALLFFVPRSIWPAKGGMTSELLVNAQSAGAFDNLSSPIMGEVFIDFGWLGVVLAAGMVGYALNRIDAKYWNKERFSNLGLLEVAYPFLLGFLVFICRGSLLYGIMWTASFYSPLIFLFLLTPRKARAYANPRRLLI